MTPIRLAIVGSRDYPDLEEVRRYLQRVVGKYGQARAPHLVTVISGGARGVDTTAAQEARRLGLPVEEIPADWARYGKSAGFRRNHDIIDRATHVVAFWDGVSHGTAHDIDLARQADKPLKVVQPASQSQAASDKKPL